MHKKIDVMNKDVHHSIVIARITSNRAFMVKVKVAQSCLTLNTPVAFPFSGDLPNAGIEPRSPALQADSFTSWATREAQEYWCG